MPTEKHFLQRRNSIAQLLRSSVDHFCNQFILKSSSFVYPSVKDFKFPRAFPESLLVYSLWLSTVLKALLIHCILYLSSVNCFSSIWLHGQVFLEPLKEIQQMGHLQHVDGNKIFCNLEELCEVMQGKHCPVELCC